MTCIEHTQKGNKGGYGHATVKGRTVHAHRKAYADANCVDVFSLGVILHSCDNPRCINPAHLVEGTYKQSTADMYAKGRNKNLSGEEHHQGKLTWDIVRRIRARYIPRDRLHGCRAMGREFGVDNHTISEVVNNLIWKEN